MADIVASDSAHVSHFRLLLWLKFRLIHLSYRRNSNKVISTILRLVFFVPLSAYFAYLIYDFASTHPELSYFIDRDILVGVFLFWVITPIVGFTLNDSYDPTRLFVYPVRYETIFAANIVGSLFEISSWLLIPVLVALLIATEHSGIGFVAGTLSLILFMLQTVALGQAASLAFIGFLRSRRFRDLMIVFFPLLMLLRYFIMPRSGQTVNFVAYADAPVWKITEFLPPGWTAIALSSASSNDWLRVALFTSLQIGATLATIAVAAQILKQLFVGDRGIALSAAKRKISTDQSTPSINRAQFNVSGAWEPIVAIAVKEWRNFVRDPQYKSLLVRMVYFLVAIGYSFTQFHNRTRTGGIIILDLPWVRMFFPILIVGMIHFSCTSLTSNIFGGEGAAITVLFSFPTNRRSIVIGKNIAHGAVVIGFSLLAITAVSYLANIVSSLWLAVAWLMIATPISLAVGNLASIRFPYKMIVRGNRFNSGSASSGAGCLYLFIWLLCEAIVVIASIPAAACIVIPRIDPTYSVWYTVSLPLGVVYSAGIYWMSLLIVDSWMVAREQDIIAKLMPAD